MNATQKISAPFYDALHVARVFGFDNPEVTLKTFYSTDPSPKPVASFITFFDPGWSIVHLRATIANKRTIFYPQTWYDNEPFAKIEELPRYRQLRMRAIKDSFGKSFDEQHALLLPNDEEVPEARVVMMGMVIHFLATGERLFPTHCIRCIDKISAGGHVVVGNFVSDGFHVNRFWDDNRVSFLGLAPAQKF
jgi:hypothetical protein